jgi:hypothetical protein
VGGVRREYNCYAALSWRRITEKLSHSKRRAAVRLRPRGGNWTFVFTRKLKTANREFINPLKCLHFITVSVVGITGMGQSVLPARLQSPSLPYLLVSACCNQQSANQLSTWSLAPRDSSSLLSVLRCWDVTPCRFIINRRFEGTCRLHLQGRRNNTNKESVSYCRKRIFVPVYVGHVVHVHTEHWAFCAVSWNVWALSLQAPRRAV